MKISMKISKLDLKTILLSVATLALNLPSETWARMDFNQYLEQVKSKNENYKAYVNQREGYRGRTAEADLITAFTLEGTADVTRDSKLPSNAVMSYSRIDSEAYSLGVSKKTTFGLTSKLSYDLGSTRYVGASDALFDIGTSTPTIKLTQSLWQNSGGSLTQANITATEHQAKANAMTAEANLDALVQSATEAYWSLVSAREIVKVRAEALKLAQSIYEYDSKRVNMRLADKNEVLVATASLESAKLNHQAAKDSEAVYLRNFNGLRSTLVTEDPGELAALDLGFLKSVALPKERHSRADVVAAESTAKAGEASAKALAEADKPVLEVYGSYSFNGRGGTLAAAFPDSYSANRPTVAAGVKFSMPLDFSSLNTAKNGALAISKAATQTYNQKLQDEETTWQNLRLRLSEAQNRLKMYEIIQDAEKAKLDYERTRLSQGRTSTYQVLLYQQDYQTAQLSKLEAAQTLIALIAQIRLYDGTEQGAGQ